MKNVTCYIAVVFFLSTIALNAQNKVAEMKVNFQSGNVSAADAVSDFLTKNKLQFVYSKEALSRYKISGVKCTNEPVSLCLKKILKGLPFEYVINGNTIIIRELPPSSGLLSAPPVTALSKADTTRLAPGEREIKEVVINAGYYKVKDQERTGSIVKVAAKEIENQPVSNVLSAVQGRMAGVSITQNSGTPGGGYNIQIRGKNSLRSTSLSGSDGNQPLYIIDGVPITGAMASIFSGGILPTANINPLNSISPNDIESIEILKDADATAIYGSRGANGVVLVTTKKGKAGKVGVILNTSYGVSQVPSHMKLLNTEQYLMMRRQAFQNDGITTYPATAYDINGTWSQNRYTDWQKTLIGNTATSSNIQATINGGSETTTFLLSLSNSKQTTVFPGDFSYHTNNISSNLNHHSRDNKFALALSNLFSTQKNNQINNDFTLQSLQLIPSTPKIFNDDGTVNWENRTFNNNPFAALVVTYKNENLQFLNNLNMSYEFLPGLSVKVNGGINYQSMEEFTLSPNTRLNPANGSTSARSSTFKKTHNRLSYVVEPQLNWKFKTGDHEIDALVGGTYQYETNKVFSILGTGFQNNAFMENVSAATSVTFMDDYKNIYKYAAVFGRINYQYKNRYIVNVTGRRDGSSRFGPNNKFANFGAVGAAWIFSNEEFVKDLKWLSFGKLRASYGSTGSDNIGDYQYLDTYTVSSLVYDGIPGLLPSRLFNPNYSWEKTIKLEAALELGFFRNRLNVSTAWYRNRSSSQLVGYQLPATTGFTSILANLPATVENTGLEIEVSGKPLTGGAFRWDTGFNLSFPSNKLISFPNLEGSTYSNYYVVGYPTSIVKLYQYEGIDPQTGLYKFKDFNADGKIASPDDNKVVEKLGIQFFGGWNNQFRYKNWDLSFLIQFVKQRSLNYNSFLPVPGSMNNVPVEVLDVWSKDNPNGAYMPYTTGANSQKNTLQSYFQNSTAAVSDASFVRLKNVQIGYRIPLRGSFMQSAKIYFQGQNLLTWTNYFGLDPETGSNWLPPLRTFSFGIQLNF
ncbi:SusC/RagA family TonB-linked outer membrane protein [Elizabethkingia anophelis]|uniref:SusC/RagA family TonB-linked outer membrane protein n=1 Tax=Elizabethkingia anophelis TaxID=1117645 RepID=UPI0013692757|nr:SusC/RagA family TonB-linked outer membrane protein [Elizabethkingia anophelis]MYY43974.1 SusC/RagA family TonB-linked outer membrane protein [Elizabethkingia anophelis]